MTKIKNLIIFLILIFVITFILFLSNQHSNQTDSSILKEPSPTPKLTSSNDPENDGGSLTDISTSDQKKYELMSNLRKKIPFENDFFTLSFDYKNAIFTVSLKNNANTDSFWNWINTNGYSEIPKNYFTFK